MYTQVPSAYVSGILDPLNRHCERSEAFSEAVDHRNIVGLLCPNGHAPLTSFLLAMTGFQRF
ncbi:MAG: hypothetical protein AAF063_20440 [Cyanobacteria bacterium J06643_5]